MSTITRNTLRTVQIVKNAPVEGAFRAISPVNAEISVHLDSYFGLLEKFSEELLENALQNYHFDTQNSRWDRISDRKGSFRLLCNHSDCSLSSANLVKGRLSVRSRHGSDNHSHLVSETDQVFLILQTIPSLSVGNLLIIHKKLTQHLLECTVKA